MSVAEAAGRLRSALDQASRGLVEREVVVELIGLAAVAGEHVLLVGPPGTGKSELARRFAASVGGRRFEYLLGRFTEPSELFGPVDLARLREGVFETVTTGMLPEAEIASLDEVFLGSTAILNTLLTLLNERTFRRGNTLREVPLRVCIGASNRLPDDPALEAFADRFLVHAHVRPLSDAALEALLAEGRRVDALPEPVASVADLDVLRERAAAMDLSAVRPAIAEAVRTLRSAGVSMSDRRIVRSQSLVAAAAVLAAREVPSPADLWPLVYAVPGEDDQAIARQALAPLLEASANASLPHAAEEASRGPAARAFRIVEHAGRLLEEPGKRDAGWRLRLEALVREIDAGFDPSDRPQDVEGVRQRLVAVLQAAVR